jgi:Fe-S cluster assembly protein SufD
MAETTRAPEGFLQRFEARERELAGAGPDWWRAARRAARARFEACGLPTSRQEAWRHTPLGELTATSFAPAGGETAAEPLAHEPVSLDLEGPLLELVDGRPGADLATATTGLPDGVVFCTLDEALRRFPDEVRSLLAMRGDEPEAEAFEALNGALVENGALLLVPAGRVLEQPLRLRFRSSGAAAGSDAPASHPLTLIRLGEGARAQVIEEFVGAADRVYLTNAAARVEIGANARLDHYRLQLQGEAAFHVDSLRARQGRDSRYRAYGFDLGGRLARHDLRAVLDGEGADCRLFGLYMPHGAQHVDNRTVLDHARPHGDSRELYKGVLDDRSSSVFSGRIVVRQDAQKTDAKQSNPNLLLSPSALAHTQPQLEIYADDVKCTHGATVGQIDAEAIFYLRSRGIPERQARDLLVHAYAGEVLDAIGLEPLRAELERRVSARLGGGGSEGGKR